MKKIGLLFGATLLCTTLTQAQLTVDDNKYIRAYNTEINNLNRNFSSMRTLDDYKNPQKRAKVEENFSKVRKIIKSFSDQHDRQVVSLQQSYKRMVQTYNKNLKLAGVIGKKAQKSVKKSQKKLETKRGEASGATANVLTSTDKSNLRKFRSEYISSDYLFRNIDSVALQDPKYRAELETALQKLQTLLNPMRSKTFDRGVARADSDLKKLEDAYAVAMAKSKKQAAAVNGDVAKELQAIQSVFDQQNFDPRLLRNYITGEILPLKEVENWAEEMKRYKSLYPKMRAFLQNVQNNSIEGRKPEFSRYAYWFETQVMDKIESAIKDKKQELGTEIFNGITKYRNYSKADMDRIFSNINYAQRDISEMLEEYTLGKKALANLVAIENIVDGSISAKSLQAQKDYDAYGKILNKAKSLSLKNQKMPTAATQDAKLLSIAKSLLPSSAKQPSAAMRITHDISRHRSLDYSQALGWHIMDYSAFAVAYAAKEGSVYRIKMVTFRKDNPEHYNRTHGGKWYLSSQTPAGYGIEIPKENIR